MQVPEGLSAALDRNPKAKAVFEQFAYSHQKAYVDWIEGSKKEETRARRIDKAIELLAEGKRLK